VLLLEHCVLALELLQPRELTRLRRRRHRRRRTAEPALAGVLPPLREHEGVDRERRGNRLHLDPRLLTQPDGCAFELMAVAPDGAWA